MKPLTFMLIAGEASGDTLGAELVTALRTLLEKEGGPNAGRFVGIGGPRMRAAGVDTLFDFTANAVFGLEALKRIWEFRRMFNRMLEVAIEQRPDAIICVDFAGFNRRFAHAIKKHVRAHAGAGWSPKIIQYVSPQVWASRPRRADSLAQAVDLLLSIFPFEKAWYARRVPGFRVEFVGHPMIDRYAQERGGASQSFSPDNPNVVLLPGSRPSELKRHLPIVLETLARVRQAKPRLQATMVLSQPLAELARQLGMPGDVSVSDDLAGALRKADLAIAKSGTITLECAYFGVPTVVLYRMSGLTYAIAKRIVQVPWAAMPNILANEEIFPEFLQARATADRIAPVALELLTDEGRRNNVKLKLREVAASLGAPGASWRAAREILRLLNRPTAASSTPEGK